MTKLTLPVYTTAQYNVLGKIDNSINLVWFVFHGYGMRSEEFVEQFECIADEQTLVVAPEGIHRFYKKGTYGGIGANWMTSDLREEDIQNNISYLNLLVKDLHDRGIRKDVKFAVLGFSQGSPTAFRWASRLSIPISTIVSWGSDIPTDVYKDIKLLQKVNESKIKLVIGDTDKYISSDQVDDLIIALHDQGVQFDFHTFSGGHELNEELIRYFHARILDSQMEY